jgi:hypothetical protein
MNGSVYTNVQLGFVETYFLSFSPRTTENTLMIWEASVHPLWSLRAALRRLNAELGCLSEPKGSKLKMGT